MEGAYSANMRQHPILTLLLCRCQPGDAVPFLFLARAFEACGETTGRLEISATVANALRSIIAITPADLLPAVYLSSCSVAPQYEGVDLGVGEATLLKALAESTGRADDFIKTAMATDGDLGIVAMKCRATQRTMFPMPILTVRGVFGTLREIAKTQGVKASERKRGLIKKLLVSARDIEAGYIMRMLQGKLGVGIAQQTVITALAHAALLQEHASASATKDATALSVLSGTPLADQLSEADSVLRQVYSECPTWDLIVPALLSNGVMALPTSCHFVPGIPIKPMLAKATRGACPAARAATGSLSVFACSPSQASPRLLSASQTSNSRASTSTMASALRCALTTAPRCNKQSTHHTCIDVLQIHVLDNGEVRVFSRNLEDNTVKYPDIVTTFKAHLKPGVRSAVLDAEAVAFDRDTKKILPFQVLSTRAKKGVSVEEVKVQARPLPLLLAAVRHIVQARRSHCRFCSTRSAFSPSTAFMQMAARCCVNRCRSVAASFTRAAMRPRASYSLPKSARGTLVHSLDSAARPLLAPAD